MNTHHNFCSYLLGSIGVLLLAGIIVFFYCFFDGSSVNHDRLMSFISLFFTVIGAVCALYFIIMGVFTFRTQRDLEEAVEKMKESEGKIDSINGKMVKITASMEETNKKIVASNDSIKKSEEKRVEFNGLVDDAKKNIDYWDKRKNIITIAIFHELDRFYSEMIKFNKDNANHYKRELDRLKKITCPLNGGVKDEEDALIKLIEDYKKEITLYSLAQARLGCQMSFFNIPDIADEVVEKVKLLGSIKRVNQPIKDISDDIQLLDNLCNNYKLNEDVRDAARESRNKLYEELTSAQ